METHHPIQYGDPRVIIMDRGDYTTCTVILKGASITSWRVQNEEQIFLSRASMLDDFTKYRGGITIGFPHYERWNFGRDHGFARDLIWQLNRGPEFMYNGNVFLELYLCSNSFTRSMWNHEFEFHYRIILKPAELETKMIVINPSRVSFSFDITHHWYLRVQDLNKCKFLGLQGSLYADKKMQRDPDDTYIAQKEKYFKASIGLDRIYKKAGKKIVISNDEDHKEVIINRYNLPGLNIWNPGTRKPDDLEADEINNFVLVDSGHMRKPILIPPDSCWTASQTMEITSSTKVKPQNIDWLKYVETNCHRDVGVSLRENKQGEV